VQNAASWSHKLRQDQIAEERRDRLEAQTARRLEIAEKGEERQAEAHGRRMTVTGLQEEKLRKEMKKAEEDEAKLNTARESFAATYGDQMAAQGYDPALIGGFSTRDMVTMQSELKKNKARFPDIASAQEHFTDNPLAEGQSVQVWTPEGSLSVGGPRVTQGDKKAETARRLFGFDIQHIAEQGQAKIDAAKDAWMEAQQSGELEGGKTLAEKKRAITSAESDLRYEIAKKAIENGYSPEEAQALANRIVGGVEAQRRQAAGPQQMDPAVAKALAAQGIDTSPPTAAEAEATEQAGPGFLNTVGNVLGPAFGIKGTTARDVYQ
jgi:hypothetical protein